MKKNNSGFTFIEIMLYVGILAILIAALIPFAWNAIEGGVKSTTEQEVFANARFISETLKYQIRNSSGINSVTSTSISLVASGSANPTVISLSSGNLTMKQGGGSTLNLNSSNTTISSLSFVNFSTSDNKSKNIQFNFNIKANFPNAGNRQEYNDSVNIEGDAEIRSN